MKLAIVLTKFPDSNPFPIGVVDGSVINEKIQNIDKYLECIAREKIKEFIEKDPDFKEVKFFISLYDTDCMDLYETIEVC